MAGETITIEDLDYGVTYTVCEITIPMYYSFSGMKIDNTPVTNNNFTFTEDEGPINIGITVANTKSNEILYNPSN